MIAGSKAKYKGEGTINGEGNYGFMITAYDGQYDGNSEIDSFRMKIWDVATEEVVYDNKMNASDDQYVGTELGAYCSIDRGKTWH